MGLGGVGGIVGVSVLARRVFRGHAVDGFEDAHHQLLIINVAGMFPANTHWALKELGPLAEAKLGARAERERLHRELFEGARWDGDSRRYTRLLRSQVAEDFAAGRVATLKGWTLSLTELRVFALLWLVFGEHGGLDTPRPVKDEGKAPAPVTGNADAGAPLYAKFCVGCHQPDGGGLDGLTAADLREGAVEKATDELAGVVAEGVVSDRGTMPGFGEDLDDQGVADVVAYIKREFGRPDPKD